MQTPPLSPISAAELANLLGGTLVGDGSRVVESCNTLESAKPDQVSFLHNVKYAKDLETTLAGVVIVGVNGSRGVRRGEGLEPLTAIEIKDTYYAWQRTLVRLHGFRQHPTVGVSPLAAFHPTAKIGSNVNIHPFVTVGEDCVVGDGANLYSHVTLMKAAKVGHDSILYPSVTVYDQCEVGNRCILHSGVVVGSDGYGFATYQGVHHKIPQTGNVVLEDDVEIGGNTVIERAVLQTTVLGKGTKLGNLVVIGHNCQIGQGNLLVSQVGIAGSTDTGKYVVMGGQVGVAGHLKIPDMVRAAAQSGIMANPEPNTEIGGTPAMEISHARRVYLQLAQLPEMAKRLKAVEKQVTALTPKEPANGQGNG